MAMGNEECSNPATNDESILETPKTILNACSWVSTTSDTNHQDGHDQEKDSDNKADPVDGKVTNGIFTFYLANSSYSFKKF